MPAYKPIVSLNGVPGILPTNAALDVSQGVSLGTAAVQDLSGAGAVSVTTRTTRLTATAVGNALTLADGLFTGQRKSIVGFSGYGSNTSVLTPAHFTGGTTLTFNALHDFVELEWDGTNWFVVTNISVTVA